MKQPFALDNKTILDLQRTAGNQFVVGLLRAAAKPVADIPEPSPPQIETPEVVKTSEPAAQVPALSAPPPQARTVWPYLIGSAVAAGAYLGLSSGNPAFPQAATAGVAFACGVGTGYVSWRLWKDHHARNGPS